MPINISIDVIAKLASPIVAISMGLIRYYFQDKARLISYFGHVSAFKLNDQNGTNVFTHSLVIINTGRKSANKVRIGHNVPTENINIKIWPSIQYTLEKNPQGSTEILIPVLAPKEQITISYLYFPPTTYDQIIGYVKCDESLAKSIDTVPTPQLTKPTIYSLWFLIFLGVSLLVYWGFNIIYYLL